MSVELTSMAVDAKPVNPKNGQEADHRAIQSTDAVKQGQESDSVAQKKTLELEKINQLKESKEQDKKNAMSRPQLEKVAEQLQEFIGKMNRGLEFSVDKDSGRDVIKVLDKTSGELIKQYPTEEVLSLVAKLSEATGNFVDSKV